MRQCQLLDCLLPKMILYYYKMMMEIFDKEGENHVS